MKKVALVAISSFVLWSCNNATEAAHTHEENETHQEATHEDHHHGDLDEALMLNDGQKWMVNEEMKPFVQNGEALVNGYLQDQRTDYQELAKQLKAENNQLIKSCTMDGVSHDELHKWLHPHLELVAKLDKASDANEAQEVVHELQDSYALYHQYFL